MDARIPTDDHEPAEDLPLGAVLLEPSTNGHAEAVRHKEQQQSLDRYTEEMAAHRMSLDRHTQAIERSPQRTLMVRGATCLMVLATAFAVIKLGRGEANAFYAETKRDFRAFVPVLMSDAWQAAVQEAERLNLTGDDFFRYLCDRFEDSKETKRFLDCSSLKENDQPKSQSDKTADAQEASASS